MQHIQTAVLPFDGLNRRTEVVPSGLTLQQIKEKLVPHYFGEVQTYITINGEMIPASMWGQIKPKENAIVGINVVAAGGGSGGKNPLVTIISIATLIAAPYLAGAFSTSLALSIFGGGVATAGQVAFASGLIRVGVSLVGYLATSALSSAPSQSTSSPAARSSNVRESTTQFIEGSGNKVDPWGVIPINLGINRMYPKMAAFPYTEIQGNDQYLRQLFDFGYGEVTVEDEKIGDTPITAFTEIQIERKLAADLHEGTGLYANDVFPEEYNVLLNSTDGYTQRSVRPDSDEVVIDFTLPEGLVEFDNNGGRLKRTVELDLQYSVTGSGVWSPGSGGYTAFSGGVFNIAFTTEQYQNSGITGTPLIVDGERIDLVVVDKYTGTISVITGYQGVTSSAVAPYSSMSPSQVAIAEVFVTMSTITVSDVRQPSLFGDLFQNSSSFAPSKTDTNEVTVTGGSIKINNLRIVGTQTSALRYSTRLQFPSRGDYDIRVKRTSVETTAPEFVREKVYLSGIKSITYQEPVLQTGLSGAAMRIKATDQLNGVIEKYNAIVGTKCWDYDSGGDTWVWRVSSNPASIYRHVLQSEAFVKRLPDNRLDLTALKEWHIYCASVGLQYNRIIDWETDVETVLNDIAAAGFATKYNVEGIYSVIVDNEKPYIKGLVTPKNSWGYKGGISYPEIPHGLIVEFRNREKGYAIDERIIYSDGYTESNATDYQRIEFSSCTDAGLAHIYGRRYLANIKLQPEIHSFYQDPEHLTFKRGDRIQFVNDCILVGVGSGRIKSLTYDDSETPTVVTGFVLDDTVEIPTVANFGVRMRYSDASGFIYHALTTTVGETSTFTFTTPVTLTDYEAGTDDYLQERQMLNALCSFTEYDKQLDLLILSVESDSNHNARIRAINYAPARFATDLDPIPAFESNVTQPLSTYRPYAPILVGEIVSDETAMTLNSDGTYLSRMIISLQNVNEASVQISVKARRTGTTQWSEPEILSQTPELLVLTGLEDGKLYDFNIFYQRQTGSMLLSEALQLRNIQHVGASVVPTDVTEFRIDVADDNVAVLTWTRNSDIDISHYEVRYSNAYSAVTWGTAQILEEFAYDNRLTIPFRGGTYLIKAVDILGNKSDNALGIVTYDPGQVRNVIQELEEAPTFDGTKDNVYVVGDELQLIDTALDGYYYFTDTVDLGYVDRSFLSSSILASGQFVNDIFDMTDVFAETDIFPAGDNYNLFNSDDIFGIDDLFGIGTGSWYIELQYRTTEDDPDGTPTWTDWALLTAGFKEFRAVQFRLLMRSLQPNVTPSISQLNVLLDVPDRTVRGKDLTVPVEGYSLTYSPAFAAEPTVLITLQDAQTGDEPEFTTKTSSGFAFKVYNTVSASYVERTFDYAVIGYGRVE